MRFRFFSVMLVSVFACAGCLMPGLEKVKPQYNVLGAKTEDIREYVVKLAEDQERLLQRFYEYEGTSYVLKTKYYDTAERVLLKIIQCYNELNYRLKKQKKEIGYYGKKIDLPDFHMLALHYSGVLSRLRWLDPRIHELNRPHGVN